MYIKQLRLSLQGKTGPALQEEENKIKIVGLRTTSNINAVIKVCLKVQQVEALDLLTCFHL